MCAGQLALRALLLRAMESASHAGPRLGALLGRQDRLRGGLSGSVRSAETAGPRRAQAPADLSLQRDRALSAAGARGATDASAAGGDACAAAGSAGDPIPHPAGPGRSLPPARVAAAVPAADQYHGGDGSRGLAAAVPAPCLLTRGPD